MADLIISGDDSETGTRNRHAMKSGDGDADVEFWDIPLSDLSADVRNHLSLGSVSLFDDPGFSELYCIPPATRVAYTMGSAGRVYEKAFYRRTNRFWFYELIDITNPIDPGGHLFVRLRKEYPNGILRTSFLGSNNLRKDTSWPYVRIEPIADDSCIELPPTMEEYTRRLGKNARKHLPYYLRRLQREWGNSSAFVSHYQTEISRAEFDIAIDLNRQRMQQRGRASAWTQYIADQRFALFQQSGLFCGLLLEGKIVAVTLSLTCNREAYLIVVAHNPQWDELNLGNVILWLTIQHSIELQLRRFHLMWGSSFYKKQFGGKPVQYYRATYSPGLLSGLATTLSGVPAAIKTQVLDLRRRS